MRDKDRIERVLKEIREIWEHNQDMRLGQLIVNAVLKEGESCPSIFHVEDDNLVEKLQKAQRKKFQKSLKEASEIVASWPKWKRDMAETVLRPHPDDG